MVLGLVEHNSGKLNEGSLQMLTLAREVAHALAAPLEAVLIGEGARGLASRLQAYGVTRAHLIQHERLDEYAPEAWAQGLVQLMAVVQPQVVMAAGTDRGHEVLAHVAARCGLPLAANCTEVRPAALRAEPSDLAADRQDEAQAYRVTRVRWGGSLLEEAILRGEPKLLTVALHTLPAEEADDAHVEELAPVEVFTPSLQDKDMRVRLRERIESVQRGVSLTDARVVVGGGRGVGSAEGFEKLEVLADLLGGAVGASRAVTNLGWRRHDDQVGQTGARIAPDLYIACGISGAIQHMVGCRGAKRILAINTDPQAPIVVRADYAIIGDLHEVIPALIEEIRADSADTG